MGDKKKRKSYKEINGTTRIGDFLRAAGKSQLLEKVAGIAGGIVTGDILGAVKAVIKATSELTPEQREYALKMAELDFREEEEISKRWDSDMKSDSWMAKNVRPYTLVTLSTFLLLMITLDSSLEEFKVDEEWISVLKSLLWLIYGAYFGSRGLEKITDTITSNKRKL